MLRYLWIWIRLLYKFQKFEIPDEFIQRKHQVFTMSPETVDFRLQEIQRIPELRMLLSSPNILNLVLHQNKVKSRLSFLQKLQLKCASMQVLSKFCI